MTAHRAARLAAALAIVGASIAACSSDDGTPSPGTGTDVNTDVGDGGTVTTADRTDTGDDGSDISTPGPTTDAGQDGDQSDSASDLGGGQP